MAANPEETTVSKRRFGQDGFTLIELLVVIIILGILAAVAVFSVGGIGNTGEESACKVDTRTLETAQAAAFAKAREETGSGEYVRERDLVADDFLSDSSSLHDIELTTEPPIVPQVTGTAYSIVLTDKGFGQCLPDGKTQCEDDPETGEIEATPLAAGVEVEICFNSDDVDDRYPY